MRRPGFTLIETVLYLALMTVIVTAIVMIVDGILTVRNKARWNLVLEQQSRFVLTRFVARVHEASSVTAPASGSASTCTLQMPTASENPATFSLASGTVMLAEGTSTAIALTSTEVEVTQFQCTRLTASQLRLELAGRLRNVSGPAQSIFSVTTTASLLR